ncbi:hypothetical protein [Proteus phage VTCCBPA139]|nr:hypothetical protein [Proteus phage VTCCBPA139]
MTQDEIRKLGRESREDAFIDMMLDFPAFRFTKRDGSLNLRKINQLDVGYRQLAKNAWFVQRALKVHDRVYGYYNVEYERMDVPVAIFCNVHEGIFLQTPKAHLAGSGCPECARTLVDRETEKGIFKVPFPFHYYRIEDNLVIFYNAKKEEYVPEGQDL